jgi:hypothetical protein
VSPLFTAVYFHTLLFYPGFVFELVALLFLLCALIVLSVRRGFGRDMMGYLPLPDIHSNITPRHSEDSEDRDRGSALPTPTFREKDSPSFPPDHPHLHTPPQQRPNGFFRVLSGQLRRLGSTGGLSAAGKQLNPSNTQ